MRQNYTKKPENYNENLFFDNDIYENEANLPQFNLERLARNAAQQMIQHALELEVTEFLERGRHVKTNPEDFRGYRNGYHKERTISTSFGSLGVKVPRVSDNGEAFQSQLVKPYKRRSEALDCLFPNLFVEGLATRDFEPALRFLVGESAPLSPSSISRLNKKFKDEYETWATRDLSKLKIVYVWADGIYLKAGIADEKRCLLVIIGVDILGTKHLLTMGEGFRESTESWYHCLRDLKKRGMNEPALAMADGGLGFWAAVPKVWRQTKSQLCWLHKMRAYFRQIAKVRTFRSGPEIARNLFGFKSRSGGKVGKRIARGLEKSGILSSDRMFICGITKTFDILRISGGTSSAFANDQCDRITICHRQTANRCGEKISVSAKWNAFGVQNNGELREAVANNQPS